jgi:hypothetical protein
MLLCPESLFDIDLTFRLFNHGRISINGSPLKMDGGPWIMDRCKLEMGPGRIAMCCVLFFLFLSFSHTVKGKCVKKVELMPVIGVYVISE